MAHEITSKDSVVYTGETPWHGIGKKVSDVMTASEAILQAGLGWRVDEANIYSGDLRQINGYKALKRSDTGDILQVCKNSYTPIQNVDAFKLFDEIVGTGMAKYEVAGSLQGGRKIWILARIPGDIKIAGRDELKTYITLINSHDGSLVTQAFETVVRVVCGNTVNAAIQSAAIKAFARHTRNGRTIFKDRAMNVLERARIYFQDYAKAAQEMASREFLETDLNVFLKKLFDVEGAKREDVSGRLYNTMTDIKALARHGKGNEAFAGTAWAAYNGVTEYVDHMRSTKGAADNRLASSWLGSGADLRQKAWDLLQVQ